MQTDEYSISLGREIDLCRKKVQRLQKALARREQQWGLSTAAFLQALEGGALSPQHPVQDWTREHRELQFWQKTLAEYEAALKSLKRP